MEIPREILRALAATRETFERLQREGYPATEAKRMIARAVDAEMLAMWKCNQSSFDEARLFQRLNQLPEMPSE